MMRKSILITFMLMVSIGLSAQTPKNVKRINSQDIIERGVRVFDAEKFEEAAELFQQIPFGDSLYYIAQYELAYAYANMEEYEKSIDILSRIVQQDDAYLSKAQAYSLLGNSYSELGKLDEALQVYDEALKIFPYNYLVLYNKGVVHLKQENYLNAAACFEEAIFCNPLHQNSHLRLGLAYLNMGLTIQGVLAVNFAVFIKPDNHIAITGLQLLEKMYEQGVNSLFPQKDIELSENYKIEKERYKEVNELINRYIYTGKGIKHKSKVKHRIIDFNQLVFSAIEPISGNKDIINYFYIPYFSSIVQNKKTFDIYSTFLFSGTNLDDNKIQERAIAMKNEIDIFLQNTLSYMDDKIKKGIGKENDVTYFYSQRRVLQSFAKVVILPNNSFQYEGIHTIINGEGGVESVENYSSGKLNGISKSYNNNGHISKIFNFKDGEPDGVLYIYHDEVYPGKEPTCSIEAPFKDGKNDGIMKRFDMLGNVTEYVTFADDQREGKGEIYYPNGDLRETFEYKEGELTGINFVLNPKGDTTSIYYLDPMPNAGEKIFFYNNGAIEGKYIIKDNLYSGPWSSYYPNGKIFRTGSYNDEEKRDGDYKEYDPEGKLLIEMTYVNGKIHGDMITYYKSGVTKSKFLWDHGKIVDFERYDPKGELIEKIKTENNRIEYVVTNELGMIVRKNSITYKNGEEHNDVTMYYLSGAIYAKYTLINNLYEGFYYSYYLNGKISTYIEYRNDNYHGLYINYYPNGEIKEEGYYHDGTKVNEWFTYNSDGTVLQKTVYDKDGNMLIRDNYFPDGRPEVERFYIENMLYRYNFYDENGQIFKSDTFPYSAGTRKMYFLNGNPFSEVKMISGNDYGNFIEYDIQGNVINNVNAFNDLFDGVIHYFYPFYKKHSTITLYLDIFEGYSTTYYRNGNISSQANYVDNKIHGILKNYYNNGKTATEYPYQYGNIEGIAKGYNYNGELAYLLKYDNNELVEWATTDKSGKMSEFRPYQDTIHIVTYHKNGSKAIEISYVKGFLHGQNRVYYSHGKVAEEIHYEYGFAHGDDKKYYQNGTLAFECKHQYDNYEGEVRTYHTNGKLASEELYHLGSPHGKCTLYDEKGKVLEELIFYYGNLLKKTQF